MGDRPFVVMASMAMLPAMRLSAPTALLLVLCAPSTVVGQIRLIDEDENLRVKQPPNISTDLLDPTGNTRMHLTTRASYSIPDEVFSDNGLWSFNLQAFLRITKGWAVHTALPFGLFVPSAGTNEFFIGNIRLGTAAGFEVRLQPDNVDTRSARLRLGWGLDVYVPTATRPDNGPRIVGDAILDAIQRLHSYEPELFIDEAMLFRLRNHAQLSFSILVLETELSLTPGFTIKTQSDALFLLSWAARLSVKPSYLLEPYVEAASSFQVAGKADPNILQGDIGRDYTTPVWLTTGVRFHFSYIDPALFVSLNLDELGVTFGIDLAGAAREYIRVRENDFLDDVPTRQR